jgi:hypothetical protein
MNSDSCTAQSGHAGSARVRKGLEAAATESVPAGGRHSDDRVLAHSLGTRRDKPDAPRAAPASPLPSRSARATEHAPRRGLPPASFAAPCPGGAPDRPRVRRAPQSQARSRWPAAQGDEERPGADSGSVYGTEGLQVRNPDAARFSLAQGTRSRRCHAAMKAGAARRSSSAVRLRGTRRGGIRARQGSPRARCSEPHRGAGPTPRSWRRPFGNGRMRRWRRRWPLHGGP